VSTSAAARTAALVIIGNEILSGRTQDANLAWLAQTLGTIGIVFREVRIVPDDEAEIVAAVNAVRVRYDYVFTTGGIGPTHDDITAASVAKAFGLPFGRNPEAERRLLAYYPPDKVNPARMRMADTPAGAELIDNPVSVAPGFRVENVHVLPGVPSIMQAMVTNLLPRLGGGAVTHAATVVVAAPEGDLAAALARIQADHKRTEIGSYPAFRMGGGFRTSLVVRSTDPDAVEAAARAIEAWAAAAGIEAARDA
jgi:molybdenum cofactor synthesis domain-containing protein